MDPSVIMMRVMRQLSVIALVFGLAVAASTGQASPAVQSNPDPRPDYSSARSEIQGFQSLLDTVISTTFNAAPFAMSQKTKGVYLQGYGMTFTFVVNIHRALLNTPFGQARRYDVTPEEKRRRIEDLKVRLIQALYEKGDSLRQVPKDESVTVVGFIEDRNFPDEANQNKTFILSVTRKDLEELTHGEDRSREFKQRMKIVEY